MPATRRRGNNSSSSTSAAGMTIGKTNTHSIGTTSANDDNFRDNINMPAKDVQNVADSPGSMTKDDDAGDQIGNKLRMIFDQAGRRDLGFQIDQPPTRGKDWNDQLRAEMA